MLPFTAHLGTGCAGHPVPVPVGLSSGRPFHSHSGMPHPTAACLAPGGHTHPACLFPPAPTSRESASLLHPFVGVNTQAAALARALARTLGAALSLGALQGPCKQPRPLPRMGGYRRFMTGGCSPSQRMGASGMFGCCSQNGSLGVSPGFYGVLTWTLREDVRLGMRLGRRSPGITVVLQGEPALGCKTLHFFV